MTPLFWFRFADLESSLPKAIFYQIEVCKSSMESLQDFFTTEKERVTDIWYLCTFT